MAGPAPELVCLEKTYPSPIKNPKTSLIDDSTETGIGPSGSGIFLQTVGSDLGVRAISWHRLSPVVPSMPVSLTLGRRTLDVEQICLPDARSVKISRHRGMLEWRLVERPAGSWLKQRRMRVCNKPPVLVSGIESPTTGTGL